MKHPGSFILLLLVLIAAVLTVGVLVFLVGYILIRGIPYLKPSLFAWTYNSDNVSMLPAKVWKCLARETPLFISLWPPTS